MKQPIVNSLLITDTFLPRIGGRENYYHHLFSRLKRKNAVVVTPDQTGDYQSFDRDYPLEIVRVEKISQLWHRWGRPGRFKWLRQLVDLCWKYNIGVVHCGLVLPDGLSGWLLNQTLGIPYIIYTHGKEILENQNHPEKSKLMALVLANASRVACNSSYTAKILQQVGVPPEKIVPILPGVDPQQWMQPVPLERVEELRQKHGLANRPIILTVGRLIERKGCDRLLEALPQVLSRFPDAVYLIVGDGPDRERLEALRDRLGLEKSVIFAGAVPDADLLAYYNLAALFATLSRQPPGSHEVEGFGIVFLEANACGLPVVAGNSGGVPDAVIDGKTGYLVDPFDTDAIASATIRLLEDPQLREQLGKFGKERALNEFAWDRGTQRLQHLIDEVAAQTPQRSRLSAAIATLPLLLRQQILD